MIESTIIAQHLRLDAVFIQIDQYFSYFVICFVCKRALTQYQEEVAHHDKEVVESKENENIGSNRVKLLLSNDYFKTNIEKLNGHHDKRSTGKHQRPFITWLIII